MAGETQDIRQNVEMVRQRMDAAARRAGRDPQAVTLIAVSKTVEADRVREAYDAGLRHFGENRVQELLAKHGELPADCVWHLIGHLQSNKARDAVQYAALIHSVDSLELAREIARRAQRAGRVADVLAQVNISAEATKSGVAPEQSEDFVRALGALEHIRVLGLMTIAQPVENPEHVRPAFAHMRGLFESLAANPTGSIQMRHLSMGMSHDFEIAIEEGATMVRVGSAIFGQRVYPPAR